MFFHHTVKVYFSM